MTFDVYPLQSVVVAVDEAAAMLVEESLRPAGPRGADSKAVIDVEIEQYLVDRLTALLPARFVGEETPVRPGDGSPYCGLVDPHDGTWAYLQGYRGSAVSVALLRDGVPVLGVVCAPMSPDRGRDLIAHARRVAPSSVGKLYTKATSGAAGGCSRRRGGSDRPSQPDKGSLNMTGKVINDSPYPSVSWDKITDVRFDSPLCLCRLTVRPPLNPNSEAILFAPFEVSYSLDDSPMESFKIDRNFITDGNSIPGGILGVVARFFGITRWGKGLEASVVHDYLYIAWQYLKTDDVTAKDEHKRFADELFRQLLLKCGVGQLGASIRYHASRTCWGWNEFKDMNPNTWYTGKLPCCDAAKSAEKQSEDASLK